MIDERVWPLSYSGGHLRCGMVRLGWRWGDQRGGRGPGYVSEVAVLNQRDGDRQRRDATGFRISFGGQWPTGTVGFDEKRKG